MVETPRVDAARIACEETSQVGPISRQEGSADLKKLHFCPIGLKFGRREGRRRRGESWEMTKVSRGDASRVSCEEIGSFEVILTEGHTIESKSSIYWQIGPQFQCF